MPISEQELLDKLSEAERDYKEACKNLTECKRRWTDAETLVIETKLRKDRITEELRVHRNTVPRYEPSPEDKDIERFRQLLPEYMKKI